MVYIPYLRGIVCKTVNTCAKFEVMVFGRRRVHSVAIPMVVILPTRQNLDFLWDKLLKHIFGVRFYILL